MAEFAEGNVVSGVLDAYPTRQRDIEIHLTSNDVQRAARILAELGPQELLRGVRKVMAQSMTLAHAEVASATLMDDADIHAWHLGENVDRKSTRLNSSH